MALFGIKGKKILIDGKSYAEPEVHQVITQYMDELGYVDSKECGSRVLFVLPHSSIVKELYGEAGVLAGFVEKIVAKYPNAYVKYHPRELGDPLDLSEEVELLPSTVPAEMFLAYMSFKEVIGDVSTALMSAKWLQPECRVCFLKNNSDHTVALRSIFDEIGVTEIEI